MNLTDQEREQIREIAQRHGVGRVMVFGSYARGDNTETSDLDLLIEVTGPTTPWFPGGLVYDLESMLQRRVDVVEARSLHPRLRDGVLSEARSL